MYWTLDTWQWRQMFKNEKGEPVGPFGWTLPVGASSCLDLRTFSECGAPGQVGVPGRYGVFVSTDAPPTGTILTDDPQGVLSTKTTQVVFDNLGVLASASRFDEFLWELMNVHVDDTLICKPLLPKIGFELELRCGPLVKRMQTGKGGPGWDNLVKQRQQDYAAMTVTDPDLAQRLLSKWEESYPGSDFTDFIPAGLPVIEPLPHRTTITENFDGADKAGVGYDLTWTLVSGAGTWDNFSNQARSAGTSYPIRNVRAESDLSSADHYSQGDITPGLTTDYCGMAVRFSSSVDTQYYGIYVGTFDGTANYYLAKNVTGTTTNLAHAGNTTITGTHTGKTVINGSSLEFFLDAASKVSVTDTAITTNTRCGMMCFPTINNSPQLWDNWSAADLAAAGQPTHRRWINVPHLALPGTGRF